MKAQSQYAIIIGETEAESGIVGVKNLATQEQHTVDLNEVDLVAHLKKLCNYSSSNSSS